MRGKTRCTPLSRLHVLRVLLCNILLAIVAIVLVFSLFRFAMFLIFADFSELSGRGREVYRMFNHGVRYDIRTATIALAPFTLLGIILAIWPKAGLAYVKNLFYLTTGLSLVALTAAICNYYYYKTYGSHFDVFVFGLFEEDTRAVLSTVWSDYPVGTFTLAVICAGWLIARITGRASGWFVARTWRPWPAWRELTLLLIFLTGYGFGVHGSFGRYPLERRDAQVSSLTILNMLTPNALMTLDWANSDHKKERTYPMASDQEGQALFSMIYQKQIPQNSVSLELFTERTSKSVFLEEHPPHVVFAVMESLSTHLLSLDAPPANDMLGAWRPFWKRDFTFTRFLSDGNGTMESLARILVASPVSSISQTRAQRTPFASNLLTPYKQKGYRTMFITSGNGSWRNVGSFVKQLGFDEVVEQSDLIRRYPEATLGTWGTSDEFSFRFAQERLEEAEKKGEHLFVLMLSITNHPPYTVPDSYKKLPQQISSDMAKRLSELSYPAASIVATFQYANDTVGRFINELEQKKHGSHTIVAITGDHNLRGVSYPDPSEAVLAHAVPFYLRVPTEYQRALELTYDPSRIGSHKDIMPTLYALSLSDTPYFRRGVNLLAKVPDAPWYFAYNEAIGLNDDGAYRLEGAPLFYPWRDKGGLLVNKEAPLVAAQKNMFDRMMAYKTLMNWQLNRQVNRQP